MIFLSNFQSRDRYKNSLKYYVKEHVVKHTQLFVWLLFHF